MGGDHSKMTREHELTPQQRFPRVINTRFVHDRMVSLRLQDRFWSHPNRQALEILDGQNNRVLFKIPPQSGDAASKSKQLLLDVNGVPVVTMDEFVLGPGYATCVPAMPTPGSQDESIENRALCYLETNMRPMEWKLYLELKDPQTGGTVTITAEGDWRSHNVLFFLDRGASFKRACIARAYISPADKATNKKNKKSGVEVYQVDVAPGVDVAMIVLACAAMDEALARKKSGQVEKIPTDETTKKLAERHHGMVNFDTDDAKVGKGRFLTTGMEENYGQQNQFLAMGG